MSVVTDSETALVRVPARRAALFEGDDLPQWALEAILIEAVREVKCSRGFLRHLLDMDFTTAEARLAERGVFYDYTPEELEAMVAAVPTCDDRRFGLRIVAAPGRKYDGT